MYLIVVGVTHCLFCLGYIFWGDVLALMYLFQPAGIFKEKEDHDDYLFLFGGSKKEVYLPLTIPRMEGSSFYFPSSCSGSNVKIVLKKEKTNLDNCSHAPPPIFFPRKTLLVTFFDCFIIELQPNVSELLLFF